MTRPALAMTLVLALTCSLVACTPAPSRTNPEPPPAAPSPPATSAPEPGTKQPIPTAPTGSPVTLKAYFDLGEKMQPVARTVPFTTAVLRASIEQLLKGPTAAETKAGIGTLIPKGTRLRGVSLTDGVATVDLSSQFSSGGGTLSMTNRLAQVVYTATQFSERRRRPLQDRGEDGRRLRRRGHPSRGPADSRGLRGLHARHPSRHARLGRPRAPAPHRGGDGQRVRGRLPAPGPRSGREGPPRHARESERRHGHARHVVRGRCESPASGCGPAARVQRVAEGRLSHRSGRRSDHDRAVARTDEEPKKAGPGGGTGLLRFFSSLFVGGEEPLGGSHPGAGTHRVAAS